jgi:hypothetical protein
MPTFISKHLPRFTDSFMRTNIVDRTSSFLLALAMLMTCAACLIGLSLWLRTTLVDPKSGSPIPQSNGRGNHAEGIALDFDPPAAGEVEQLREPALEQSLKLVDNAIDSLSSELIRFDSLASASGDANGDHRLPDPLGEGEERIPRYERWELKFTARDQRSYAIQLDACGIELGAIGGGIDSVDYVRHVASAPTKHSVSPKQERARKRLKSVSLSNNRLLQFEKQILQANGIAIQGRQVLKFIPSEMESILALKEREFLQRSNHRSRSLSEVYKTVFECRPQEIGPGFEFVVIDQR